MFGTVGSNAWGLHPLAFLRRYVLLWGQPHATGCETNFQSNEIRRQSGNILFYATFSFIRK